MLRCSIHSYGERTEQPEGMNIDLEWRMSMRKFYVLAAAFLAVPVAAEAGEPVRFERDGYRFEYVVDQQSDGSRLITGRDLDREVEFRFHVRGRKVTGDVGDRSVSFLVPRTRIEAKPTLIASK